MTDKKNFIVVTMDGATAVGRGDKEGGPRLLSEVEAAAIAKDKNVRAEAMGIKTRYTYREADEFWEDVKRAIA